jgi:SAM-dependent methyltransferase
MRTGALAPYEQALSDEGPLSLIGAGGFQLELEIARWLAPANDADATVIARCVGPVLDVGCGPGRFVRALAERGIAALGLDIADSAVTLTRRLDVPALLRDVFDPAPAEGRWPTVLLMDGNVGIGGDIGRLLARVRCLLAADGRLLVETARDRRADRVLRVRFGRRGIAIGPSFEWAEVGLDALRRHAEEAGYSFTGSWTADDRTFVELVS